MPRWRVVQSVAHGPLEPRILVRVQARQPCGEVSERYKEHAWKACVGETQPWVRIPPSPPHSLQNSLSFSCALSDGHFAGHDARIVEGSTFSVCFERRKLLPIPLFSAG